MIEITCAQCGGVKARNTGEVNRALRTGAKLYCGYACMIDAKRTGRKALGWHERRFEERPGTVPINCSECGTAMWLPLSKSEEYKRCGKACNAIWRNRMKRVVVINDRPEPLERPCETCGVVFRPRPNLVRAGQGRFCSQQCNTAGRAALAQPDVIAAARERLIQMHANGLVPHHSGSKNHNWKGGKDAALERRRSPEGRKKQAESLRRYRAENPHKVHEFSRKRNGRKLGRLEYGSIPRIGTMQKWKCAICRKSVKQSYHVDHIVPLAKGGEHAARNIQLLCGPCNVRKSAKDPMDYMRQIGRLL